MKKYDELTKAIDRALPFASLTQPDYENLVTLIHEQRRGAVDAMEKAEYELAMGKSIIDQFLTDEGRKSIGYCGTGKCGLCPMCRMNNALNILKFSRLVA